MINPIILGKLFLATTVMNVVQTAIKTSKIKPVIEKPIMTQGKIHKDVITEENRKDLPILPMVVAAPCQVCNNSTFYMEHLTGHRVCSITCLQLCLIAHIHVNPIAISNYLSILHLNSAHITEDN